MIRTAVKAGVLVFVAMLVFGGVETIGWLHHAWTWIEAVIHSSKPTVKLPTVKLPAARIPTVKLPPVKLPAMPGKTGA